MRAELRGTYRINRHVVAAAKTLSLERSQELIAELERQNSSLRTSIPKVLRHVNGEDSDIEEAVMDHRYADK